MRNLKNGLSQIPTTVSIKTMKRRMINISTTLMTPTLSKDASIKRLI
jgi:hypothetical protein